MLCIIQASPQLTGLVGGYWFVEDIPGAHEGRPIRTSTFPGAVLSVNIGRPNAMEDGPVVPKVSLLGVQTAARRWRSWSDTYFVMAMLSLRGLTRLFPETGLASANSLLDVADLIGDGAVLAMANDVAAAWEPRSIASRLDRWLIDRLDAVRPPTELARFAVACDILRNGGRVSDAASAADITRRQLHRWSRTHTGIGPKQLSDIGRLQSSIFAVQTQRGDPLSGFSDQAHQIRSWRKRLATTPRSYEKAMPSTMATSFSKALAESAEACAFYL
jgi:AraC-like DNA-binding protein